MVGRAGRPRPAWPQHLTVLREAWAMGVRRPRADDDDWRFEDLRREVYRVGTRHQWPLHLMVWVPAAAPPPWRALVVNRLVSTLGPQLDAGGFFARPLCDDDPLVYLLWPQDCTASPHALREYLLPLRARLAAVVFRLAYDGYLSLWPAGDPAAPPLADLLPQLRLFRRPPDPQGGGAPPPS